MAAVTVCSDVRVQENKICHCSDFLPYYLPWNFSIFYKILPQTLAFPCSLPAYSLQNYKIPFAPESWISGFLGCRNISWAYLFPVVMISVSSLKFRKSLNSGAQAIVTCSEPYLRQEIHSSLKTMINIL